MSKTSICDVATLAGVSIATVSRTFAHPEKVSASTRAKVMRAAEQMEFTVSRTAGELKTGRSYRITLLIGSSKIEWFSSAIIEGLNNVLQKNGYDLVIYLLEEVEQRKTFFKELPLRANTDAIIVSSFDISNSEAEQLQRINVPIVGINCTASKVLSASIGIDDALGIKLAIQHLATLGHRRLLYVYEHFCSPFHFSSSRRITSFENVCRNIEGMQWKVLPIDTKDDPINATLSEIFAQDNPPTAICFHQDSTAMPFLFRLQKLGIRVPEDLSIIGFDNGTYAKEAELTTIRQNPKIMAEQAGNIAISLIEGKPVARRHITAPLQLIIRKSTAAPKAKS
ncbi:LacI family DNA-binding transcriptional regulator [Gardnerella vaginalis]|nr:LacI family DNA-binding transcriptional regulator [Gardnerella vaginalis]